MSYELIANGPKKFAVAWELVERVVWSHSLAWAREANTVEATASESKWLQPSTWGTPRIRHLETDWPAARSQARARAWEVMGMCRRVARTNCPYLAEALGRMIDATAGSGDQYRKRALALNAANLKEIEKSVGNGVIAEEGAKVIRSMAAETVIAGAAAVTGGAALALLGAGAAGKGRCKYQDTDSVAASAWEAAGSFVFGAIPLTPTLSKAGPHVLAFVQAGYGAAVDLLAGKSFRDALADNALKVTGSLTGKFFDAGPVKELFARVTLPVWVTHGEKEVGTKLFHEWSRRMTQKGVIEKGVTAAAKSILFGGDEHGGGGVVRDATVTDRRVLHLAVVNMELGIGRGW